MAKGARRKVKKKDRGTRKNYNAVTKILGALTERDA
jgi:hypothetical protein